MQWPRAYRPAAEPKSEASSSAPVLASSRVLSQMNQAAMINQTAQLSAAAAMAQMMGSQMSGFEMENMNDWNWGHFEVVQDTATVQKVQKETPGFDREQLMNAVQQAKERAEAEAKAEADAAAKRMEDEKQNESERKASAKEKWPEEAKYESGSHRDSQTTGRKDSGLDAVRRSAEDAAARIEARMREESSRHRPRSRSLERVRHADSNAENARRDGSNSRNRRSRSLERIRPARSRSRLINRGRRSRSRSRRCDVSHRRSRSLSRPRIAAGGQIRRRSRSKHEDGQLRRRSRSKHEDGQVRRRSRSRHEDGQVRRRSRSKHEDGQVRRRSRSRHENSQVRRRSRSRHEDGQVRRRSRSKHDDGQVRRRSRSKHEESQVRRRSRSRHDDGQVRRRSRSRHDDGQVRRRSRSKHEERQVRRRSRSRHEDGQVRRRSRSRHEDGQVRRRSRSRHEDGQARRRSRSRRRSLSRQRIPRRSRSREENKREEVRRSKSRPKDDQKKELSLSEAIELAAAEQRARRKSQLEASGSGRQEPRSAGPDGAQPPSMSMLHDNRHYKVLKLQAIQVRSLLGRGGETVNQLRRMSGSDIKIHHPPMEAEGTVSIVGDVERTLQLIKEALAEKGCPLLAPGAKEENSDDICISPHLVGLFVGTAGMQIRELQNACGGNTCISVQPADVPGGLQRIRIVGDNREMAKQLVRSRVEAIKSGKYAMDRPAIDNGKDKGWKGKGSEGMTGKGLPGKGFDGVGIPFDGGGQPFVPQIGGFAL